MGNLKFTSVLLYFIIALLTKSISAQSLNMQSIPTDKIQVGLSFNRPFYSTDRNMSAFSGVYQLHGNVPISSKTNIVADIPFITTRYEFDFSFFDTHVHYAYSENGLGNIFVGLQSTSKRSENKKSIFTLGAFLPTADEKASINGFYVNYYDFQKYYPNSFGFYLNYAFHKEDSAHFVYGFEIGPNFLIPTKKYVDGQILIHYGITGGFQINKLLFSSELIGMFILTEDIENFGDRFIHSINIGAQWRDEIVNPKVYYKIYLDHDINHIIDGVLGIGVNISFN